MPQADQTPERRFFSIRQKVLLGFGLAIVAVVANAIMSYRSARAFISTADWVAHTHRVLEVHATLLRDIMDAESATRGYVITGDEDFLTPFQNATGMVVTEYGQLRVLVASEPEQTTRLSKLKMQISWKLHVLESIINLRRSDGVNVAVRAFNSGEDAALMREIRAQLADFATQERNLLSLRAGLTDRISRSTIFSVVFGGAITIALLCIALAVILRDITARRKAEEQLADERNLLRNLIDAIPQHIFVKDLRGRYVLDNAGHRKFLQVKELSDVVGKSVFYYFPQELATLYHNDDQDVIQSGKPILNREEPAVTAEGKLIWLSTTKVPLRDLSGKFIGLVCVSSDISERKAAEEKLRMFAAQLERSNDELRDFASVASHDLQEPLRKIQAFSDRLQAKCSDSLGEVGRDYLGRIQGAAARMQILIQDLLTLSRISSKAQPFVMVDLHQVIKGVLSDLELRIEQTGALIEVGHLTPIEADPLQMRQLFQNLISNALKFQAPGKRPEISISSKLLLMQDHQIPGACPGEEVCRIMVKDNGIGFEEQFTEQIFAVFQRLHSRQAYEGTGIGLAVCRKIANRHGGSIVAKSTLGEGSTFIVTLPIKQVANP